jgi:hypothetical protein
LARALSGARLPATAKASVQLHIYLFENSLLSDQEIELTYRRDLFLASVLLIENLGGGWDTNLPPSRKELEKDFSLLPQLPPSDFVKVIIAKRTPSEA